MLITNIEKYKRSTPKLKPVFFFDDARLAKQSGGTFLFDIECYQNMFLVTFKCFETGQVVSFERSEGVDFNKHKLIWILDNIRVVGFNSYKYDIPMLWAAIHGKWPDELKNISQALIAGDLRPREVEKEFKFKIGYSNHIDIFQVAPGAPQMTPLKQYGARLHTQTLQDLPIHHESVLSDQDKEDIRIYCINDLDVTGFLLVRLEKAIKLREEIGMRHELDLRSKSDAQIAEAVIASEIEIIKGKRPQVKRIPTGTPYQYKAPTWVKFYTPVLQELLKDLTDMTMALDDKGNIQFPDKMKKLSIKIGKQKYSVGRGGLHSCEKSQTYEATEDMMVVDRDVESYYPKIILNQNWYPENVGIEFLNVYRELYEERIAAKKAGDKATSDSLKIVINGTFGKTSNKYSFLYDPCLLVHITLTGQLALLMMIEMLEFVGIEVVSANTDGVVSLVPKGKYDLFEQTITQWEQITDFKTEETRYSGLYSENVNNYIAIMTDGEVKAKGVYVSPTGLKPDSREWLTSNPSGTICIEAVKKFLSTHTLSRPQQVASTIRKCKDITQFLFIRKVKGGAVKDQEYLGRVVRWYMRKGEWGSIKYATSGNNVAGSVGGYPLMELPEEFPKDIDYDWYIREAHKMLKLIGFYGSPEIQAELFD